MTTQQDDAQAMKAEDTTMTSDDTTAALSAATAAAAVAAASSAATAATPALAVAATPLLFGLPPMSAPGSLSNDGGAGTNAATPALQAPPPLASAGLQPMPSFLSPFAFGSPAGWQPTPQQYMAWQSHMASASAGTPGSAAALHSAQQQQLYGPYSSSMQLGSGGNVPMFAMPAGGGGMMSAGGASAGSASGDAINLNDERRPWTKEEDQKVNELVKKHGNKKWYAAARLSTYTHKASISTAPKTTNCNLLHCCSFHSCALRLFSVAVSARAHSGRWWARCSRVERANNVVSDGLFNNLPSHVSASACSCSPLLLHVCCGCGR